MDATSSLVVTANAPEDLITSNIEIWTSAIQTRSSAGRGSSKKLDLYGIKKLRELILELAVRGKLVPQDPNDEPATVLLKRITAEKAHLVNEKKLKKTKAQAAVSDNEVCVSLPQNWEWVRFGDIAQHNSGKTLDKGRNSGIARPYLTTSNLYWGRFELDSVREMLIKDEELDKCSATKGDLLICEGGDAGRAAVWNREHDVCFQNHIHRARFFGAISPYYMFRVFEKLSATGEIDQYRKGVGISNMSGKALASVVLPLPPLAEQHRIVAKVDELMALCDQLEQQTEASIDVHATLVETLLATLTGSGDAAELEQNWTRIAAHFDTLFTTDHSIEQLKQTVLQLAFMGKLVPQDPSDEPAAVLLEKIAADKARLVKEKKIKKQKPLPPIGDDEKPFALPNGLGWARIGDVLSLQHGYAFKSKYFVEEATPYILTTPGNFHEVGGFRHRGNRTKYYDGPLNGEFFLEPGDLIIPMTEQAPGLLGSAAFIPKDKNVYLHNQRLGKLTTYSEAIAPEFVYWFFNCRFLRSELARTCTGTTVRHTSPAKVLEALIPVMSLSEQHRIVAKLDQLMTLCDQLKERLQQAQQTQLHLADALVEKAVG
ncbi:restriction endonuclease subunit S [Marinobacterium rhizophilum]|uniref:restriction endonuclease subunit S n=1 Tax=Marinobacterium rhizophilum TaxID=420402 RepID=UPI00036F73DC|nr:restriction endonuclease subunit S [Marinobacterium rhizophilum]